MVNSFTRFAVVSGHTFGERALEGLLSSEAYLEGRLICSLAVSLAEDGRSSTVGYRSLTRIAAEYPLPNVVTDDGSLLTIRDRLKTSKPDFILVIGWSRIVAPEILDIPREQHVQNERNTAEYGCIGMHPTRLPQGRGQAPIPWTIIFGLRETALTTFFLEESVDSGPIIQQQALSIHAEETASSLFIRFADLHFHAGRALAGLMAARRVEATQQANDDATVWRKRRPADSRIDFATGAAEIVRLVKGLRWPYPRAFVQCEDIQVKIEKAEVIVCEQKNEPGFVSHVDDRALIVGTVDGWLRLTVEDSDLRALGTSCRRGMRLT